MVFRCVRDFGFLTCCMFVSLVGEFFVRVRGKRVENSDRVFGDGDLAIDELSITAGDPTPPSNAPPLG